MDSKFIFILSQPNKIINAKTALFLDYFDVVDNLNIGVSSVIKKQLPLLFFRTFSVFFHISTVED